jgi:hypothetical protein
MSATKVHLIPIRTAWDSVATTACGKEGYRDSRWADEFDTAESHRFEAVTNLKRVTCKRCLAAARAALAEPVKEG